MAEHGSVVIEVAVMQHDLVPGEVALEREVMAQGLGDLDLHGVIGCGADRRVLLGYRAELGIGQQQEIACDGGGVERGRKWDLPGHGIGHRCVEEGNLGGTLVVVLRWKQVDVVIDLKPGGPGAYVGELQDEVAGELLLDAG